MCMCVSVSKCLRERQRNGFDNIAQKTSYFAKQNLKKRK